MTVSQVAVAVPSAAASAQAGGVWQAPEWWPWPARPSDGPVTLRCPCGSTRTRSDPDGDLTAARLIAAANGWVRDVAGDDRCPVCAPGSVRHPAAVLTGTRF